MAKIYHQLGFRYNWNLEYIGENNTEEGVICAPRYMSPNFIQSMPESLIKKSLFDPQFFIPDSKRGSLVEYDFFPQNIANGFDTFDYSPTQAFESAIKCVDFQAATNFEKIILPVRFVEANPSDFIETQNELFIEPFLKAYSKLKPSQPLLLQLVLNGSMITDIEFRSMLLNWITGMSEIQGVYLIPKVERTNKQIRDIDYLVDILRFIKTLRENDMDVVLGYQNTESIVMLCADPTAITIGSYENLRMFKLNAFKNEEEGGRGPVARIYSTKLLQWIEHQYKGTISRVVGNISEYFDESIYNITMFEPSYKWHFGKPDPYKHYFSVFSKQFNKLNRSNIKDTIKYVKLDIENAMEENNRLRDAGIIFDINSDGSHLGPWLTSINSFNKKKR